MRGRCALGALLFLAAGASHGAARRVEALTLTDPALRPVESPNRGSFLPSSRRLHSADGRFVAIQSNATNLDAAVDDLNGASDVWLLDRARKSVQLVSHRAGDPAHAANAASRPVAISRDGARVLFASPATDLVAGQSDSNGADDLFLFDRASGSVTLVSHRDDLATGTGNGASGDGLLDGTGQRVLFRTAATNLRGIAVDTNGVDDTWLFDAATGNVSLVSSDAGQLNQAGSARSIPLDFSRDGRFMLLLSGAASLLAGQVAGSGEQVFLFDRFGPRRMVSHAAGAPLQGGNAGSGDARFSGDGSAIVFGSRASNLVAGVTDTNNLFDIFVQDRAADTTRLASFAAGTPTVAASNGNNATALVNDDGSVVAFSANGSNLLAGQVDNNLGGTDVFLHSVDTGTRVLASRRAGNATATGNARALLTDLSGDGKRVLFRSQATDHVAGQVDGANSDHLFLFEVGDERTTLVSHRHDAPAATTSGVEISGTFTDAGEVMHGGNDQLGADDDNGETDVYVFDGVNERITRPDPAVDNTMTEGGFATVPAGGMDANGRYVAFMSAAPRLLAGTTGASGPQLWIRDRLDDSLMLATHATAGPLVRSTGTLDNPPVAALSADGEWLAFVATAGDLSTASGAGASTQVYLVERGSGDLRLVTHAAGNPAVAGNGAVAGSLLRISDDGRFVAFASNASNLVAGQSGVAASNLFLYDRDADATTLVSRAAGNATQAAGGVFGAFDLTPDGEFLAFASTASAVADGVPDTNGAGDVFLHVRASGANLPVSRSGSAARMSASNSFDPALSADGARLAFRSQSNDLLPGTPTPDTASLDVFVWQRDSGAMTLASHHHSNPAQAGNGNAGAPQIDAAGRRVVFTSDATDLVAGFVTPHGDDALFGYDVATNTVRLVSHAAGSSVRAGDQDARFPMLARDGTRVSFVSRGSDFVPDQIDAGGALDVFLADLDSGEISLASHRIGAPNVAATPNVGVLAVPAPISGDGELVGFGARGNDLVRHDGVSDDAFVYVHDEPVRLLINAIELSPSHVGEAYRVQVAVEAAKGPAIGRVTVDEGSAQCSFDLGPADDGQGHCDLVSSTPGVKTITARFTSDAGFESADAPPREQLILPPAAADLSLVLEAPATVAPGDAFTLRVRSANAGPDRTGQVVLQFAGLPDVIGASGFGWTCDTAATLRCTRDILFQGMADDVVVQLEAPASDALLALQATISSALPDPDASDDSATANVQVDGLPEITGISPPGGDTEGGYPLQIAGANFGSAAGQVDLGGLPCAVSVWTPAQIVCSVPPGAGVRDVQVVQAATVLDRTTFAAFAYDAPQVDGIAPALGAPEGNYPMTISGRDFGAAGATVTIAGVPCTGVQHDAAQPHRRLVCNVPAGTGANLPVVVTQSGQASDGADRFAYAAVVADLLIDKASARTEVFARGVDEWTLLVSNLGPDRADGARIVDVLPAHLVAVSWTCTGLAGATCGTPGGVGDLDLVANLPAGGSALVQVSARLPRGPLLDLVNTARVDVPAGIADPVPANNADTEIDPMASIFFDEFE